MGGKGDHGYGCSGRESVWWAWPGQASRAGPTRFGAEAARDAFRRRRCRDIEVISVEAHVAAKA